VIKKAKKTAKFSDIQTNSNTM